MKLQKGKCHLAKSGKKVLDREKIAPAVYHCRGLLLYARLGIMGRQRRVHLNLYRDIHQLQEILYQ